MRRRTGDDSKIESVDVAPAGGHNARGDGRQVRRGPGVAYGARRIVSVHPACRARGKAVSVRSFVVGACLLLGAALIGCGGGGGGAPTPVNHAPAAEDQTVADGTVSPVITLAGTDVDGDALSYVIVSLPAGGELSDSATAITGSDLPYAIASTGPAGEVTYTYGGSYTGVDSFTFRVSDGSVDSAVATVLIGNNNTQPTATVPSDPIATVNEDGDGGVVWAGQDITGWRDDVDDDSVTYTFTQPANGTLTGDETGLIYTPNADFPYAVKPDATDSFTFQMSDGLLDSPVYTVNVRVTNVNDAPVAGAVSASTDINTDITDIQLTGTDVDGDTLTYSINSAADLPQHGTIYDGADPDNDPQLNAGNLALAGNNYIVSYRPEVGWAGADSFKYKANDGSVYSGYASVTITVRYTPGTVLAWGRNGGGELGDGTLVQRNSPVRAQGLTGVRAVAGGELHTLAVKDDGTAWAWGANWMGQLGDGTINHHYTPAQVPGLTDATAVAACLYHSLAMKSGGTMWAWGYNGYGQLGDGSTVDSYSPIQVPGLTDVTAIGAGAWHSLAVGSGGAVWAWGENLDGGLGDGTTVDRLAPVQTLGVADAEAVDAGGYFSVALKSNGTVLAWGSNGYGQLGVGTTFEERLLPGLVPGLTSVTAISTGPAFCLAVKNDGTVWAWGHNEYGQLGDGTTTDRHSPIEVPGLTDVKAISTGYGHALALKNDGTVWAWGWNMYGQLGDGTTVDKHAPLQVQGVWGIKGIDAGIWHSLAVTQ